MSFTPRPEIAPLGRPTHGGLDDVELTARGMDPRQILDFSANINPFGPSRLVRLALNELHWENYPDRHALAFRMALARNLQVRLECILAANGASELIWLIALAFLRKGDRILVIGPTYGEYARASAMMGASVHELLAREDDSFSFPERSLVQELNGPPVRAVFLANPNNPTGNLVPSATITSLARRYLQTLFIIDEAYLSFAHHVGSALTDCPANMIVVRSMTKDHALAGLRLGYAVGDRMLVECLSRVQPPWSVNAAAQAAGIAALQDPLHLESTLRQLHIARDRLIADLCKLGLHPQPSAVHFFLLPVSDGAVFRDALLRRQIAVRDCASFGLPQYVRIATRQPEENERLLQAVRALLRAGSSPCSSPITLPGPEVAHGR